MADLRGRLARAEKRKAAPKEGLPENSMDRYRRFAREMSAEELEQEIARLEEQITDLGPMPLDTDPEIDELHRLVYQHCEECRDMENCEPGRLDELEAEWMRLEGMIDRYFRQQKMERKKAR